MDFIGFFVKIQSPVCPPNALLSFGLHLQGVVFQHIKQPNLYSVWENKYIASENSLIINNLD